MFNSVIKQNYVKITFFETLDDVADERRAVDRYVQHGIWYDAGTQRRAHSWHAASGAAGTVVATTCSTFNELMELGAAEWSQTSYVGHVRVERTQGHAHLPQFDVHATVGQIVRRRGQLAVVDDLFNRYIFIYDTTRF